MRAARAAPARPARRRGPAVGRAKAALPESVSSALSLLLSSVELGELVTVAVSVSVEVESSSSVEVEVEEVELVVGLEGLGELVKPVEPIGESEGKRPVGITGWDVVVSSDESVSVSVGVSTAVSVSVAVSVGSRTDVLVVSVVSRPPSVVVVVWMENCDSVSLDIEMSILENVHPEQQQGPRRQGRGRRHAL
ncbi:hypothetical protein BJX63DRAFT_383885 [Aspergillus granulosus]|uniref:Uncharacterized protein n=1 Tax=Aspergillus granulosus TaxID=176169 RepID=A0ABR4HS16_9EURO